MSSGMGTAPQLLSAPTPIWYPARTTVQWTGGSYELFDNLDDLHVELPIQWVKQ